MLHIYIDADACPVKQEVFKVAERYQLEVTLVANSWMRVPDYNKLKLVVVKDQFDAADDWIVEHLVEDDLVITGDILLADRCIKKKALVLGTTGKEFTEDAIGGAIAMRAVMADLRDSGAISGGPAPFQPKDRSRFLQSLDRMIQSVKNKNR